MNWKRQGMSLRLPQVDSCLSENDSIAVTAKCVISLICCFFGRSAKQNRDSRKCSSPAKMFSLTIGADRAVLVALLALIFVAHAEQVRHTHCAFRLQFRQEQQQTNQSDELDYLLEDDQFDEDFSDREKVQFELEFVEEPIFARRADDDGMRWSVVMMVNWLRRPVMRRRAIRVRGRRTV